VIVVKIAIKLVIVLGLLMLPFAGKGYAENEFNISEVELYEEGMANSFEEALTKNERLSERYGTANAEQQQQMTERWQERKAEWDGMSGEEKAAKKVKMQERKTNRGSKGRPKGRR